MTTVIYNDKYHRSGVHRLSGTETVWSGYTDATGTSRTKERVEMHHHYFQGREHLCK